jgi:hypothetical protein
METATTTTRYAQPRTLLRWNKNPHLQVLKMLAWVVYDRLHVRNARLLEMGVDRHCEPVMKIVLGEEGMTLDAIKAQTLAEQGAPITATKLLQRADKTDRYSEYNDYKDLVVLAYDIMLGRA